MILKLYKTSFYLGYKLLKGEEKTFKKSIIEDFLQI